MLKHNGKGYGLAILTDEGCLSSDVTVPSRRAFGALMRSMYGAGNWKSSDRLIYRRQGAEWIVCGIYSLVTEHYPAAYPMFDHV